MCGIAGLFYADRQRPVDPGVLKQMSDAIAHRGPDAEGFWNESGIGLAHRRLSIIDLTGGNQPIGNEDDSVQVVFNGEIYNYQELRKELEDRGHRFRTRSDTETLVHLYEEMGDRLVERLRGMFAFAIWDRRARRLLLARDRLGLKPLYLYRDHEKLLFGSEIKAILAHPGVSREVDVDSLEEYLALGMVPGGNTVFRRIEKLKPAHVLSVSADTWSNTPRRYWELAFRPDESRSAEDWEEAVRAKIAETARRHLIADVPVGAFLSGGIDSSIVVALTAAACHGPLHTFSIGFAEEAFSELGHAREVAQHYGTRHTEQVVTPDAVSLVDELTHYFDEPFADSSAIPTFLVSRLARQSVKVVLSGDGGDEAFGGYSRYVHDMTESVIRRQIPHWFRHSVLRPVSNVWPKADWLPRPLRAKTMLTNLSMEEAPAYANTLTLCRQPMRGRLLGPQLRDTRNGRSVSGSLIACFEKAPAGDALGGMLATDTAVMLPDDYLVKVDRASMANGIEVRPPLVDHELMELAARIPSRWKVQGGQSKWILKSSYRDLLPKQVLNRPKQGFEIPIDIWLRGPLRPMVEEAVLRPNTPIAGLIDQKYARSLFARHLSGTSRLGNVLWSLLVLGKWAERYLR